MNKENNKNDQFAFTKKNYILLAIGVCLILIGIITMQGGSMDDMSMFDSQRTIVAPIIIMLGFIVNIFAILNSTKENNK